MDIKSGEMAGKEKGKKSSLKLRKICNFFAGLFNSCENTSSTKNKFSGDEASAESFNRELVGSKEVLKDGPKGNDDSKASQTNFQDKDKKDLSELVKREVGTGELRIESVQSNVWQPSARISIRNRGRQNRSKSAERLCDGQYPARSKSPKPCQFKTKNGGWFCEVCSWTCSNGTFLSFLDHCNTKDHKQKLKGRFNSNQDISQNSEINKWISELEFNFIEPASVGFVRCKLCEKLFPAGKFLETFLLNVRIHIEGKSHVRKLEQMMEASNTVANMMKKIEKCPTRSLTNLNVNEKFPKKKKKDFNVDLW